MTQQQKTVVLIPAFNEGGEQSPLSRTLFLLRQTKFSCEVIVIDDGSKDNTEKIAREHGCHVIRFPINRGKTAAFLAGAKEAIKQNATAVITLDADMTAIPLQSLQKLAQNAHNATQKRESEMTIADVKETFDFKADTGITLDTISGIRSFSAPALYKLASSKLKKFPRGYGLEMFLNLFFAHEIRLLQKSGFKALKPHHQEERKHTQRTDVNRIERLEGKLKKLQKRERQKRKPMARPKPPNLFIAPHG